MTDYANIAAQWRKTQPQTRTTGVVLIWQGNVYGWKKAFEMQLMSDQTPLQSMSKAMFL